jgi:cellulose synthase/poly-beta-1,6-N-acetylglucosamine synthase-like glycosyltransferase
MLPAVLVAALVLTTTALYLVIAVGMLRRLAAPPALASWPNVDLVIAAHNEERALPATLASLAALDYPGRLRIVLVDDRSRDATPQLLQQAAARDRRVKLVRIDRPSPRFAPKVHAIARGVAAGDGEIILTSDADTRLPTRWVQAMVAPFADPRVVWVLGTVTTQASGAGGTLRERLEAIDWLSLMLVSRALARLGANLASSANAQGYRRAALAAVGGFGLVGRAPSGDEELLLQRLGTIPGARTVFIDDPDARVVTGAMPSWQALWRQRVRWASRYQHALHYQPAFWAGISLLGIQSLALSLALLALPWQGAWAPWVLGSWGIKLAVELTGMRHALRQFGYPDLVGPPLLLWALGHPLFVAATLIASLLRPRSWRGASHGYRRRVLRALWHRHRRGRHGPLPRLRRVSEPLRHADQP